MNPSHRSRTPLRRDRGVALVITLFFIVIITILIIGLLDSSRVERAAAGSHYDRMRAGTIAHEGIEIATATLHRETADPPRKSGETDDDYNKRKRNWISQPGVLIVPNDPNPTNPNDPNADQKQLKREIPLSTGAPSPDFLAKTNLDPVFRPTNLNIRTLVEQTPPTYLITDRREKNATTDSDEPFEMYLRWVYVRQDGSYELPSPTKPIDGTNLPIEQPDLTSKASKANPIVARFAYWVDDESSKVNCNLAWKRNSATTLGPNSNPAREAHPSRINLMGLTLPGGTQLTEPMADTIHNWTTTTPGRYFNSFADARQVSPAIAQMLDYNKFELTHYNHDPDTTFFGEDRIMLTMNRNLVPKVYNPDGTVAKNPDGTTKYARKFLDILREQSPSDPTAPYDPDPGILEHIAGGQPDYSRAGYPVLPNKFDAVVRRLMNYISTKNWPLAPGVSFKEKYYPGTTDTDARLGQIAVNIIDYVRAKESAQQVIAPLRFALQDRNNPKSLFTLHPNVAYGGADSYQGICRAPYITELGAYVEKDPVDPPTTPTPAGWPTDAKTKKPLKLYRTWFKSEIYLPPNYGFQKAGIDLVPDLNPKPAESSMGWFASWTETRDPKKSQYWFQTPKGEMVLMGSHSTNAVRIMKNDVALGEGVNGTVLNEGKRVVITKIFYRDDAYGGNSTLGIRAVIFRGLSGGDGLLAGELSRWPRVNIGTQTGNIPYPISDPAKVPVAANMISLETDDPRCNVHPDDWKVNPSGKNSFGAINERSTLGKAPTKSPVGKPQQDTDASGKISDHSFYMPPPKGIGTNGPTFDNGRVTSIAELGYVHTGNDARTAGGSTPWRSIRLQPNNYPDAKTLPDWAFMDLFTVPNTGATGSDALFKPHGTSVGGRVNVNSHVSPFDRMIRDRGLVCLLTGARQLPTAADAKTIAENVYTRTLATGPNKGKVYGYPWPSSPTATIASNAPNAFDTPGEICEIKGVADGGEKSEDLMREVASLVTSRGGVFTVYTIGQALKQTPGGKLLVMAEQRQQAMIERYLDNKGTPDAGDDESRIRTVYFRNLTP